MKGLSFCLALLLLLTGCGAQAPAAESASTATSAAWAADTVVFTDDLGRCLEVAKPQRVAALIGSFADIWCLAGGKDQLVAAAGDSWTSFDLELGDGVADLGAIKEPNLELLLYAQPDLVLGSVSTAADLELEQTLEAAGIPVAYFDVDEFDDYLRMLEVCTRLTGCPENYTQYGQQVARQVEQATERQDGSGPRVLCLRATGASCKAKGSHGNVLGEMLSQLGCVNIADGEEALLDTLSMEAILVADPDYVFVVYQGADPARAIATFEETVRSDPAWSTLGAVKAGRVYTMEHRLYNLKPNARWGEAYEKLADILYPKTE